MILMELFLSFAQIGLFSVGGGYAAIPLIQNQTVTVHQWLTAEQFMDLATIAEMTPGPIAINGATFVGLQLAGLPGALVASLGCIFPSLVLVSLLFFVYRRYRKMAGLQRVLSCLRPAVVGLIVAAGLNMFLQLGFGGRQFISLDHAKWASIGLFALAMIALRMTKMSPILIMSLCGAGGLVLGLTGVM